MIRFELLRYKNFLSTGNVWTEVRLDAHNMTLIIGKNGHGKSTLIDALCYVLFGKAFRKINLDGLINSINQQGCCVEIEFSIGSTKYKVIRGMRPAVFEIYEDGVLVDQEAASRDHQRYLEKQVLGFGMKSFTQIVVVGSNSFTPFMRLGPQDRRAIIEQVLDIDVFSTMNTVVKAKVKTLSEGLNRAKAKIATTREKIELQKRYIADNKKANEDLVEAKQKELEDTQAQEVSLTNRSNTLKGDVAKLRTAGATEAKVRVKIRELEGYRSRMENNVDIISKELKFLEDNSQCPTCEQHLENKDALVKKWSEKMGQMTDGLKLLQVKATKLEEDLTAALQAVEQFHKLQLELAQCTASLDEKDEMSNRLREELEEMKARKPISEELLQVSRELVAEIEELNRQRVEFADDKAYYDLAALLLKDSGIKTKIIKQYLPIINKLVNKYLAAMDFFVNFEIDEEFQETIKSRHRDAFSYENFSEGQKRRIDLSLLFTWRAVAKLKNSVNTNLLILDEILDGSLDANGVEEFMILLNTFGNEMNTFLISHRGDILADKFNHTLRFELHGNFSEVESV